MAALSRRLGIAATAALTLAACGGDSDAVGLPAIVLPALAGFPQDAASIDTGDIDGPAVVNLWATWCVPCRAELPEFQQASDEHPSVRFVGLDEGFAATDSVAFLTELGVTYEQFVDVDGSFADELEITELPATVIVDGDGDVALRHVGALPYDDLVGALAEL